jgi:sugar lactone lactonase YvrE
MKSSTTFNSLILLGFSTLAVTATTKFPTNPKPDLILGTGIPSYYNNTPTTTGKTLDSASSVVVSPASGKVFVADTDCNRILRFKDIASLTNAAEAEEVFGQVRFDQAGSSDGALGLSRPSGIFLDRFGRLWIADSGNNRVVMYQNASSRIYPISADKTFGRANSGPVILNTATPYTASPSSTSMNSPSSVWVDSSDRLWVSDSGNARVLRFDNISNKESGAAATGVLGKMEFTSPAPYYIDGPTSIGSIAISPTGSLFVSQPIYNRVVRFDNAANLPNGANPSSVLGQPDFSTDSGPAPGSSSLSNPSGITITPDDSLWVLHGRGRKVTIFASASTKKDGGPADEFLMFPREEIYGRAPSRVALGIYVDYQSKLWVPGNYKLRRYSADETKPVLSVLTVIDEKTELKELVVRGGASDEYGISKVHYSINNGKIKFASGTTNWKFKPMLKVGKNRIRIVAIDSVGNVSLPRTLKIVVKK